MGNDIVEPVIATGAVIELGPTPEEAVEFIMSWGAFRGAVDETDHAAVAAARTALTEASRPARRTAPRHCLARHRPPPLTRAGAGPAAAYGISRAR
ncbi:MAG: hypothetical protein GEV11_21695 [Streptosporangiales bacterium]|nr:hypothetical protein [Streptosporangiales bacterium]